MTLFKFTALRSLGLISGVCISLLSPSTGFALMLDNFETVLTGGNALSIYPGDTLRVTGVAPATVLSDVQTSVVGVAGLGTRTTSLTRTSSSGTQNATLFVDDLPAPNQLAFNSSNGLAATFTLDYKDFGSIGGALDFSVLNVLSFEVINFGPGGTFTLTLDDSTPNPNSATLVLGNGDQGTKFIPISAALFPNVTLSDVTKVTFSYTGLTSSDITISGALQATIVPEPSSLALALTGLGMAGVYFRRRRKQLIA